MITAIFLFVCLGALLYLLSEPPFAFVGGGAYLLYAVGIMFAIYFWMFAMKEIAGFTRRLTAALWEREHTPLRSKHLRTFSALTMCETVLGVSTIFFSFAFELPEMLALLAVSFPLYFAAAVLTLNRSYSKALHALR